MSSSPHLRLVLPATVPTLDLRPSRAGAVPDAEARALVQALREGVPAAPGTLFDTYAGPVERVLCRMLGTADVEDPLAETFSRALDRIDRVSDPDGLKAWLVAIAVNVAREQLRARRRRGWLRLSADGELPEPAYECPLEARAAVRELYAVLDRMPEEERTVFALRHLEGMTPTELSACLNVSLATAKRRIVAADARFDRLARRSGALLEWLERGDGRRDAP